MGSIIGTLGTIVGGLLGQPTSPASTGGSTAPSQGTTVRVTSGVSQGQTGQLVEIIYLPDGKTPMQAVILLPSGLLMYLWGPSIQLAVV